MQERYRPAFALLTRPEATVIYHNLVRDKLLPWNPVPTDGSSLFEACRRHQLDQATAVLAVAHLGDTVAIAAIEKLVGKPITRRVLPPVSQRPPRPNMANVPVMPEDDHVVTFVAPNPKKVGSASHARYALWQVGKTLREVLAAGLTRPDVRWDTDRGFVRLGPPT